jgi:hypothetical protein
MRRGTDLKLVTKETTVQRGESTEDGIRFVLSTDDVDLMGDIVVQSGLSLSRSPLPAQIDHGGGMFDVIGEWKDFQIGAHQTTAALKLLKRGVSRAADLVRDLYKDGVQLAASIGFMPDWDAYELIRDDKNEYVTGIKWLKSTLTEASIVVTPANPAALARAKSLRPTAAAVAGQSPIVDVRAEILVRLQGAVAPAQVPRSANTPKKGKPMNIGEQIRAAETALNDLRDKATKAAAALEQATEDEAREALLSEMDALAKSAEDQQRTIATLKKTELMLATRGVVQPQTIDAPALMLNTGPVLSQEKKRLLIVRHAACTMEAYLKRQPLEQVMEKRYGRDQFAEATRHVSALLQEKAAQNPAMTSVPEWAGALVRDGYGAFMEALQVESIVPRLPLQREEFDGFNSISVAGRKTRAPDDPNLAGAFRAEGAPIRVGSASLEAKKLTPKSMGIIGTFTLELFKRSTPNIEQKIQDWMIEDTSIVLDGIFLGAGAGSPTIPAGITNGLAVHDTIASTGNSAAQIDADVRGRIAELMSHRMGRRPVWIMNSARALGLAGAKTAAGTVLYPTMSESPPKLYNIPVQHGINVQPATTVILVDAAEIAFAGSAPEFAGSEHATFHEEYVQADVKQIVDGAGVVAQPVRNLFQTYSAALRGIWEVDWLVLRVGAVQTITGATW